MRVGICVCVCDCVCVFVCVCVCVCGCVCALTPAGPGIADGDENCRKFVEKTLPSAFEKVCTLMIKFVESRGLGVTFYVRSIMDRGIIGFVCESVCVCECVCV